MRSEPRTSCIDFASLSAYQPDPPPPPPPPPDDPPPLEPDEPPPLDPGAVEAEATVVASALPTRSAKFRRIGRNVSVTGIPDRRRSTRGGRRRKHAREAFGPAVLDIERDRIGQIFLEQCRGLFRRMQIVQPIFFGDTEILLEALDLIHDLAARDRRRSQQLIEEHQKR